MVFDDLNFLTSLARELIFPSALDLNYFLEVAKVGNISRAAERLGISQPTLTQAIQKLERQLGVSLLIREKRGVALTAAGRRIMQRSRELLSLWEQLHADALEHETKIQGHFSIGCHASVARYTLPRSLPGLLETQPLLRFSLVHDLSRHITEGVISRKIDIGIVINPVARSELVIRHIGTDSIALWENKQKRRSSALICDPELLQTQYLLPRMARRGISLSHIVSCPSLEIIASLTESGAGYGLLPARIAALEGRSLTKVNSKLPEYHVQIKLIYRSDFRRTTAAKFILSYLEDSLLS